ncbi:phosphopantetheine-binding protein [Brachybacterium squillarum]|uniref:phosphopantetheine-binding protein n=1 Tax=Brachybacterium squillarum TaxID=661979 RepID=UPI000262977B|nr:phosphopantetheine-binding protein [Brachybacterium squillarum]
MARITLQELLTTIDTVVGEDDDIRIDESILDTPFERLDFDSLHIIAVSARLEQGHGFKFPEGKDYALVTPRELIDIANAQLSS